MKSLIISAGPIPAKLDSVKLITNKFKGGLAIKTAQALAKKLVESHRITLVIHELTAVSEEVSNTMDIVRIKDVYDYFETLKTLKGDTYVLAGAVANLTPVTPWKGKFPSHDYQPGDVFPIDFTIAPRAIDHIREWHPKANLIGYKLFDGTDEELIRAGQLTLREAKAHAVFCNHPAWAKERKITLTQDGSQIAQTFDEHVDFIAQIARLEWYQTQTNAAEFKNPKAELLTRFVKTLGKRDGKFLFGTAAYRNPNGPGFITTTRGKSDAASHTWVQAVDHEKNLVLASQKPTLNAPTLDILFKNPKVEWVLHGHQQIANFPTEPYTFPGTTEDALTPQEGEDIATSYNSEHHGFYVCCASQEHAQEFLDNLPA